MQGYQQFAAGKAMMGAGEGMAKGGGDGGGGNPMLGGAGLGVGMGMAPMFQQQNQQKQQNQQAQAQAPQSQLRQLLSTAQAKLPGVADADTKARLEGLIHDLKASVAKGDKAKQGELEAELNDLLFVLE